MLARRSFLLAIPACSFLALTACGDDAPTAAGPRLRISDVHDFGNVFAGTDARATFTIENTSADATAFAPLVLVEGDAEVAPVTTCSTSLGPGSRCEVTMAWHPSVAESVNVSVVVFDDPKNATDLEAWVRLGHPTRAAGPRDLVVPLRGTADPRERLVVTPTQLRWSTIDNRPQPKYVHLESAGIDPASTAFVLDGLDAASFSVGTCPTTLAPKASCDLEVTPAPVHYGSLQAKLHFQGAACDLLVDQATAIQYAPLPVPTTATLRAVAPTFDPVSPFVVVGDHGTILRGGPAGWKDLSVATDESLRTVSHFGGVDSTYEGKTYRYREDERDLVVAGGSNGGLYVTHAGSNTTTVAWKAPFAVTGLDLETRITTGDAQSSDYVVRPYAVVVAQDASLLRSLGLDATPPDVSHVANLVSVASARSGYILRDNIGKSCTTFITAEGALFTATTPDGEVHPADAGIGPVSATSGDGGDEVLAVGPGGAIYRTIDCLHWTAESSGTTATLHAAAVGARARAVVGDGGVALVSMDHGPWTPVPLRTQADLLDVRASDPFVAVGAQGTVVLF